jgi:ribonuclease P/MRP protein subunit POP1
MPLLMSLTHTGTRVAGQRERETQRREAGVAYYPRDAVGTLGERWFSEERAREEKAMWDRKPPAKRVNWEKVGTECPWNVDWEEVIGVESKRGKQDETEAELLTTQRDGDDAMDVDHANEGEDAWVAEGEEGLGRSYWLLHGQDTPSIISMLTEAISQASNLSQPNLSDQSPSEILHSKVVTLRHKIASTASIKAHSFTGGLDNCISAEELYQRALVKVRLRVPRSGSPEDLAVLYMMGDEEAKKWRDAGVAGIGRSQPLNEVCNQYQSREGACVDCSFVH